MKPNCAFCGVKQERWRTKDGIEHTNIDPISNLCLVCLIARTKEMPRPTRSVFDPKLAQTGERE